METNAEPLTVDGAHVLEALQQAHQALEGTESVVLLDFSAVRRVSAPALTAMQELADAAQEKSAKVVLRGVNVEVYKVLKLMNLTPRFGFVS
jgi:anti-anti-sigma regulatory factor